MDVCQFVVQGGIANLRGRLGRRVRVCAEGGGGGKGGKMVVDLVGAFKEVSDRMSGALSSTSSAVLFKALKLSIPILHSLPLSSDGRPPLTKALSRAMLLADLQMDAEVISAGLLTELTEVGALSLYQVRHRIGVPTAHLLHETSRVNNFPSRLAHLDDAAADADADALRAFCLSYYDVRALILALALKLDLMRHLDHLPRYQQQTLALQVIYIHAPLAHALGTISLSLELQDLSFRYLFPHSYLYVDTWLRTHATGIHTYKDLLLRSLQADSSLAHMVHHISVKARYKSRYSTMKKLLRDGRTPEEVNDVMGLRVILEPNSDVGERACYRAREIIQSLWKHIPHRTKDYIANPKPNGYKSLHMAVDVSDNANTRPLIEIQIRTTEMDMLADGGSASHSLYKGGLTDPKEAKRLKAIMMAAAELAALRLKDFPSKNHIGIGTDQRGQVFRLLDKNGDGRISIEELTEVMEELGTPEEDAREMMQLLDANSDGSLSSDEFDTFQKQVEFMRNLEDKDNECRSMLNEKIQTSENSGLIQVYSKEFGNRLAN